MRPIEGLEHQRHVLRHAAAEDEGRDRHAGRILPGRIDARALRDRAGEAGIGMGRLVRRAGDPILAAPIDQMIGHAVGHAFPPHVAIVGQRDIGEDGVGVQHRHGVGVGRGPGARRDAEEAGFRIDGAQGAAGIRLDPGDVVADGPDLPALEPLGRHHHGEIGLAAGAGEGGGDVGLLAGRIFDADDQHMLGQPALVARHHRGDAQRETLLAEQRVAAIARAERPDRALFGEMGDDDILGRARPGDVFLVDAQRLADRMDARHERAVGAQHIQGALAHAGHHPHAGDHIGAVGQFDADMRDRAAERAHREGHDIEGAAAHAALEQAVELGPHRGGIHPVIGRAGILLLRRADEGAVLDARHVGGVGAGQEGVGTLGGIEAQQRAGGDHPFGQHLEFGVGAVAPMDRRRLRQLRDLVNPGQQLGMMRHRAEIPDFVHARAPGWRKWFHLYPFPSFDHTGRAFRRARPLYSMSYHDSVVVSVIKRSRGSGVRRLLGSRPTDIALESLS